MKDQSLGDLLKKARKEKGFTLRELSKKSGVSHSYISQLENGRNSNPTPLFLKRIADALNIPFTILAALTEGESKIGDDEIGHLQEMEKEAEQAIEMLNMLWAGKSENYKLVLEDESLGSRLDLEEFLNMDEEIYLKQKSLTPQQREQLLKIAEIITEPKRSD